MAKLPRRHLVPGVLGDDLVGRHSVMYKIRHSPLLAVLSFLRRRAERAYLAKPTMVSGARYNRTIVMQGGWQSIAGRFDRALLFQPALLPKDAPIAEPVCSFLNFEFCHDTPIVLAANHNLRGKRVLCVSAGGLGDIVIFAQLVQTLRERFDCVFDVVHRRPERDAELFPKLFPGANVYRLPLAKRIFSTYDYVLPLGMHHVFNGETLNDYFMRCFEVPYEPHGFHQDADAAERVLTRMKYRHDVDPLSERVVFVQMKTRGTKNYPHMEALVQALVARGHKVAMIGAPHDSALPDEVGRLANLCGVSVWQTIHALRHAAVVVTPDSLFLHVAGAWRRPTVALFGPTSAYWASAYPDATVVNFSATCRWQPCWVPANIVPPCERSERTLCMSQIAVKDVVGYVEKKLAGELSEQLVDIPRIPSLQVVTDFRDRLPLIM